MISGAGYTDIGKNRRTNEDDFLVFNEKKIYVVCDGVGGQRDGAIASHMAAGAVRRYAQNFPPEDAKDDVELKAYFDEAISGINKIVYEAATSHEGLNAMATTMVLAYLRDNKAYVVNLGDSRAYLIRGSKVTQITEDHTYVNQLIREGSITKEEAKNHPQKHMITRALGAERIAVPDCFTFETKPGDWIILCSDGMYNEIPTAEMARLAEVLQDPETLAKTLVSKANDAGGDDNITTVAIRIDDQPEPDSDDLYENR